MKNLSPNPSTLSDPALIQACLDGDDKAWKELIQRYRRLVYSIPHQRGFTEIDAEEVFQNVFIIVFRRLANLRDVKALPAWLISITQHECDHFSKRSRYYLDLDESIEDPSVALSDQVQLQERQQQVRQAIGQLESPCRDLLTALFLEASPPSYEELAARFGIPVGSIGPTRARCFKKLEAIMIKMGIEI